jgi:hypothetical protein
MQTTRQDTDRSVGQDITTTGCLHLHVLLHIVAWTGDRAVSLVEALEEAEVALSSVDATFCLVEFRCKCSFAIEYALQDHTPKDICITVNTHHSINNVPSFLTLTTLFAAVFPTAEVKMELSACLLVGRVS